MKLKNISLKKKRKEKQKTSEESFKLGLIFHTRNSWNNRSRFNYKAQFPANLMLEDEITKKIKKFSNKKELH
jgi:hypothetical protein